MKVITRATMAAEAAEKWKGAYCRRGSWIQLKSRNDTENVYSALIALGSQPDPDAVDKAIGNGSWTLVPECDECGKYKEAVVQIGESDHEFSTACVCSVCLNKAIIALRFSPSAVRAQECRET